MYINKYILLLSIIGTAISLHLWIQKERSFDQGCWGIAGSEAASTEGCTAQTLKKGESILGVPTAAAAFLFFLSSSALSIVGLTLPPQSAQRAHDLADIAISVATPLTLYLIYLQVASQTFCPLCLVIAGTLLAMAALHLARWRKGGYARPTDAERLAAVGYAVGLSFVGIALIIAVLFPLNKIGLRPLDRGLEAKQIEALIAKSVPAQAKAGSDAAPGKPTLDKSKPALDLQDWVGKRDVAGALPEVALFLDPNCPHCSQSFAAFQSAERHYSGKASFHLIPRPLWSHSVLQIQALELARAEGKYMEMWGLQFKRQKKGGLNQTELTKLFGELGLHILNLEARLGELKPAVLQRRDRAQANGITSTPALYINGYRVRGSSDIEKSLATLLETKDHKLALPGDQATGEPALRSKSPVSAKNAVSAVVQP